MVSEKAWYSVDLLRKHLVLNRTLEVIIEKKTHSQLLGANIKSMGGHVTEDKFVYMPHHPHPIKVHITMTTSQKLG